MEYINGKKKRQNNSAAGSGMTGSGSTTRPAQPTATVQSSPKATTTAHTTTTTYRPGVSQRTQQALSGYEGGYKPSEAVTAAQQYLQQIMGQKPGEYQSPYLQQLDDLYGKISGRKPFTYDLNADMLYQQYRDQYKNLGQQAMMDTMGQAAGLTGGYGSSYSQNAGQQAYQGYLQQLNDKVPELYQLAMNKYQMEGDDLLRQYGLLSDRENQAYGRYRDTVNDWRADVDRADSRYNNERNFDYGQWGDMRDYWQSVADRENSEWWQQTQYDYQKDRDRIADEQWQKNFDYQAARDAIADAQWQKQFDANQAYRAAQARASSAAYDELLAKYNEVLKQQHPSMNPYAYTEQGTKQGRVEIPGYGTINFDQYQQMLKQGLLGEVKYDKKTGQYVAQMKPGKNYGPFNMLM